MAENMKSLNGYGFDAQALGGKAPEAYASAEELKSLKASDIGYGDSNVGTALDTLEKSVSPMTNKTETPYAAGKVWTSLASGAGWADAAGGTQIVLLWQNASPSSDFAAQTVSLNLADFDLVMMIVRYTTSNNRSAGFICPVGADGMLFLALNVNIFRYYSASVSGVEFQKGQKVVSYDGNSSDLNKACIPTAIYGIKGVSA